MIYRTSAVVLAVLAAWPSAALAQQSQFVMIDETYTHNTDTRAFSFFPFPAGVPTNWTAPVNYRNGRIYARLEVFTKPSTRSVRYQICLFQDEHTSDKHACMTTRTFSTIGLYNWDQDMDRVWQVNKLDFTRALLDQMLVVKDGSGNPVDDRYGFGGKWDGSPDFSLYYPMDVRFTAIVVAQGAAFAPPADWTTPTGGTVPPPPPPPPPAPPPAPRGPSPNREGDEGCGATGWEAVLAFGLLAIRRRRSR